MLLPLLPGYLIILMSMMKAAGHQETKLFELNGYGHSMVQPAVPLLINEVHRITEAQTADPSKDAKRVLELK
jgi:hypothetical protein